MTTIDTSCLTLGTNGTGFVPLEQSVQCTMIHTAGDPAFLGLMLLGFFFGIVFLMNLRMDAKMAILVPAGILSIAVLPWIPIVLGLCLTFICYLAWVKIDRQ